MKALALLLLLAGTAACTAAGAAPQVVATPVPVEDCTTLGCPDGEVCVLQGQENVCVKESVKK